MDTNTVKREIIDWVNQNTEEFAACSQFLFDNPELGMQEHKAAELLANVAEKHGFTVEKGVGGMPTAFVATYGSGAPVIGFNVEYDALPGLSQKVVDHKEAAVPGGPGHGCGHCLLGPAALQAGIALRYAMERHKLQGTLKLFGSPAEELCVGKVFLAKAGVLDGVDLFLDWHPWFNETYVQRSTNAYLSKRYHFKGKTSHGNAPWNGRSALDAAVLTGIAAEMLREHIPPGTESSPHTINYTLPDVGAPYPNVVPDHATIWFLGRFTTAEQLLDGTERIDNCAKGAALATGTTVEEEVVTILHESLPNMVLGRIMHDNYLALGPVPITEEEQEFCKIMQKNAGNEPVGFVQNVRPPCEIYAPISDSAEYSWAAPTATMWISAMPGPALHSWVITSSVGSDIGKKSMYHAAKVLATSTLDVLSDPQVVEKAQAEHKERLNGRVFKTLVPEDAQPPVDANK